MKALQAKALAAGAVVALPRSAAMEKVS
jgi:hypothetical protein